MKRRSTDFKSGKPIRLLLLMAVLMAVISGGSKSSLSDRVPPMEFPPEGIPINEILEARCIMPDAGQGEISYLPTAFSSQKVEMGGDVPPIRSIIDPYPSFNGIAIDSVNGHVLMSDTNKKSLLIYDRSSGSKSSEETRPLRQIIGPDTNIGFIAGVAMDPVNRELYAVNNDIEDRMVVFSYGEEGNLKPKRILHVPYSSWGVALNQPRDEIAVTVQQINAVVIYRRESRGLEPPVRSIIGSNTGMADPHGVFWDETNNEILVSDHGNTNGEGTSLSSTDYYDSEKRLELKSGGRFHPPSIHVYAGTATGNAKPLRTIQGPMTQLNWPTGMAVDSERNEIAVANSVDNSILIFRRTDSGNVAPSRIIRGSRTGIDRPMGVAIDKRNNELWVANFGDHTAVVFDIKAKGNVSPKRVVRNAPRGTPTAGFGNPMALAYDSKRDEIVIGN